MESSSSSDCMIFPKEKLSTIVQELINNGASDESLDEARAIILGVSDETYRRIKIKCHSAVEALCEQLSKYAPKYTDGCITLKLQDIMVKIIAPADYNRTILDDATAVFEIFSGQARNGEYVSDPTSVYCSKVTDLARILNRIKNTNTEIAALRD